MTRRPVLIANSSGFYGDRDAAAREMVDGGPIDVLTGDYLAELTMLILWKARRKDPDAGYARTALGHLEQVLGTCLDRGIKIVTNAGGLNPAAFAQRAAELAEKLGLHPKIAYITGDDLLPRLAELHAAGHTLANMDTGQPLAAVTAEPATANAYLGGWGITAALGAGADVVVCPRVTDASLVTGPAAWWHGWARDDFDALAGALVAGHVIECGPQATGGNYSFLDEITDRRYPGFPIAEVARDGSSVVTKHPGTGGLVSVGTVTAQLLYEIAAPEYANPDVTAHFDTVELAQAGPDRVAISGVRGSPPPATAKVAVNFDAGYRNTMTLVLTGLDIEAKAAWAAAELFGILGGREQFDDVDVRLLRFDTPDAPTNERATAHLRITVKDRTPQGRPPVLQRDDGTRPRRLRGLPHHHAADPGELLRGVLAGPGPVRASQAHRGAAGRHAKRHPAHARRRPPPLDDPPAPHARPGPARQTERDRSASSAAPAPATRAATRTSACGPGQPAVRLARRLPDGGPAARAADRGRRPPRPALRTARLHALNFVVTGLLGEGVAASTRPDPQAKGLANTCAPGTRTSPSGCCARRLAVSRARRIPSLRTGGGVCESPPPVLNEVQSALAGLSGPRHEQDGAGFRLAPVHIGQGTGRVRQRVSCADGRDELARFQQREQLLPLITRVLGVLADVSAPAHTQDADVVEQQAVDLDRRDLAAGEADDQQPAAGGQGAQGIGEAIAAHRVHDDVHARAAGERGDRLAEAAATTTSSAPAALATAAFSSLDTTAMDRAPYARTSCRAAVPIPPAAPCTRTVSPWRSGPGESARSAWSGSSSAARRLRRTRAGPAARTPCRA